MATGQVIVDKALRAVGRISDTATSSGTLRTNTIAALNELIDRWKADANYVPVIVTTQKTLVAGTGSYTIGTGADINVERPTDIIDSSYVRFNGNDTPVHKMSRDEYNQIVGKSTQGLPGFVFFDPQATAVIYLYPVPDQAYTLFLTHRGVLSSYTDHTTDNALLPGYETLIWRSLALDLLMVYPNPAARPGILQGVVQARNEVLIGKHEVPVLRRTYPRRRGVI